MKNRNLNKNAVAAILSAQVSMFIEAGGEIKTETAMAIPPRKNFGFDALNKSRSSGAGRGGKMHNAGLPRTVR